MISYLVLLTGGELQQVMIVDTSELGGTVIDVVFSVPKIKVDDVDGDDFADFVVAGAGIHVVGYKL
jgi:hypothetical protein